MSKLRWMKWLFIILPLTISMGPCQFASTCKTGTIPDLPDPVEPKYYTIQLKYVRPLGSITRPDLAWKSVDVMVLGLAPLVFDFSLYDRSDDYNFNWSEDQLMPDNETSIIYSMWGIDEGRWDSVHNDTAVVGDIFFIRVKETGFEMELTNVMQNNHPSNVYPGPNAKMTQFRLMENGTITLK